MDLITTWMKNNNYWGSALDQLEKDQETVSKKGRELSDEQARDLLGLPKKISWEEAVEELRKNPVW